MTRDTENDCLAIIAGGGNLPRRIAESCREKGRPFFLIALKDQCSPETVEGMPHAWFRLGAAGSAMALLHEKGIRDLVMAGNVTRPGLTSLRPDMRTLGFWTRIGKRALGDDALLKAVIAELESEGFRLLSVPDVLDDILAQAGQWGRNTPDDQALADIRGGIRIGRAMGSLDVGQSVILQQGIVIGVEAIEGTDRLIERCGPLQRKGPGGVLVKLKKPQQEDRADLPTVGDRTVKAAARAGLRGIAVEAGATLVLDPEAMIREADRHGLFLIGLTAQEIDAAQQEEADHDPA